MAHTAIFTTMVTGVGCNNFTYQWRHNGSVVSGETEISLSVTNVMESDRGEYICIVSNQFGDTDASNIVVLMVTSKPAIVMHVILTKFNHLI